MISVSLPMNPLTVEVRDGSVERTVPSRMGMTVQGVLRRDWGALLVVIYLYFQQFDTLRHLQVPANANLLMMLPRFC